MDESSGRFFGAESQYSRVRKALTNGYLYYDPGELVDFGWRAHRDLVSYWNGFLHSRFPGNANRRLPRGVGHDPGWHGGQAAFNLTTRSLYSLHFVLKPGAGVSSGGVLVLVSADPFSGLEYYAETYGRLHKVKLNPIINGWCSWFYTHTRATEEEQLKKCRIHRQPRPAKLTLELQSLPAAKVYCQLLDLDEKRWWSKARCFDLGETNRDYSVLITLSEGN